MAEAAKTVGDFRKLWRNLASQHERNFALGEATKIMVEILTITLNAHFTRDLDSLADNVTLGRRASALLAKVEVMSASWTWESIIRIS